MFYVFLNTNVFLDDKYFYNLLALKQQTVLSFN